MIQKLLTLVFVLSSIICFSQMEKDKFQFALSGGLNQSFFSGKDGITDFNGFFIKDLSIGFKAGAIVKYNVNPYVSLVSGFNLISFERLSYRYHGVLSTMGYGKPQVPLLLQINFSKKPESLLLSAGVVLSYEVLTEFSFIEYSKDVLRPRRRATSITKSFLTPLLQIGIGRRKVLKSGREIEQLITFNKGFKVITSYTLERFDPYLKSTFSYKGNSLSYTLRWYFKND